MRSGVLAGVFVAAGAFACALTAVAVQLTDFQEPHPWSPRRWATNNGTFEKGVWVPDFKQNPHGDILNSFDIPVSPRRFILEIEASADAAGAALTIWTVSGAWVSKDFGRIAAPSGNESVVRQTFVIEADLASGWKWVSDHKVIQPKWRWMPRPSRFLGFHIQRGTCRAARPKIRFVSFAVEGLAEKSAPEVRLLPPAGEEPPRLISACILNASTNPVEEARLDVAIEDWDGRSVDIVSSSVRGLKGCERRVVEIPVSSYPAGRNYFRYRSTWVENGFPKRNVLSSETSWTRPVIGEGTRTLRPDLPWGMNLALSRNQPLDAAMSYDPVYTSEAYARMEKRAELARKAGVKWERVEFHIPFLRPSKDQWNWEFYDRMLEICNRNGICGFGLAFGFPSWVKPYTEDGVRVYCDTLKELVRRYRGKVFGWEIWNEPNIHFWAGPKEEYFKLADRAYAAVREMDGDVPVIALSAASTPTTVDFARDFFASGARFSDVSIHTYCDGFKERDFLGQLKVVSELGRGCRLWVSEMGWTTGGKALARADEHAQAAYLVRVYLSVAGSPHAGVMNWYDFVDDGFNYGYSEENFGVLRRDQTPKPAYRALALICNRFASGNPSLRDIPLSDGNSVWCFGMGTNSAVWADCDEKAKVKVETSTDSEAVNAMGERVAPRARAFILEVDGEHPLFFSSPVVSCVPVEDKECVPQENWEQVAVVKDDTCGFRVEIPRESDPPRFLRISLGAALRECAADVRVEIFDWNGTRITDQLVLRDVERNGEFLVVPLPELPDNRNYFRFSVKMGAFACDAEWTRPLTSKGSTVLCPDLPWGLDFPESVKAQDIELARMCGAKWGRISLPVTRIRPSRDTWAWDELDRTIDLLRSNGISICGTVRGFPKWTESYSGEAFAEYLKIVQESSKRYKGKVDAWEISARPDPGAGRDDSYFDLVSHSYYRVRAFDDEAPIVALSLAAPDVAYAKRFCGRWWNRYNDLSVALPAEHFEEGRLLHDVADLSAAGDDCWIWISGSDGLVSSVRDTGSADGHRFVSSLVRAYLTSAGNGMVRAVNGYRLRDDPNGTLGGDVPMRPAFRALSSIFRTFTKGRGRIEGRNVGDNVTLWIFRMGGRCAVWTNSEKPRMMSFFSKDPAVVVNLMGERMVVDATSFSVAIDANHPLLANRELEILK